MESFLCVKTLKFMKSEITIFDFETKKVSFEYEYGK